MGEGGIFIYDGHTLDAEISNFIKVWTTVVLSLSYCYVSSKFILPKRRRPLLKLLSYTPVIGLFLALPLSLHSMHLCGTTSFFVAWLSNFKLLLLAFDRGPLSDPSLTLPKFIATGCFPIKIDKNKKDGSKTMWNYAIKGLLVAIFVRAYDYSDSMHPKVVSVFYCFHIYFMLELMLAAVAFIARATLGVEIESQFNEPYLSTSLQDFWGRRWNIMVSRTLRPTVYDPALELSAGVVGRKWAPLVAVFCTFFVSAVMHELIFYYLGRTRPTGMITWFFLLHAASLMVEIAFKKLVTDRCRLPALVSTPLTVGYVLATGLWLFMPELLMTCKADVRAIDEYARLGAFLKGVVGQS